MHIQTSQRSSRTPLSDCLDPASAPSCLLYPDDIRDSASSRTSGNVVKICRYAGIGIRECKMDSPTCSRASKLFFSAILGHVVFKSGQRCTTFTLFHGSSDKAPTAGRRVTHHPCGIWHTWALARSSRGKG